jgi:hypothetical protein
MLLILTILATSCVEISYQEPQPKGIKPLAAVPKKLQGSYQLTENGKVMDDVMVVFKNGYRFKSKDSSEKAEEFLLGDSIVLKYYKGYYFVNNRATYNWHLRIVKRTKKGDLRYFEMENVPEDESSRVAYLNQLQAEVPVIKTEIDGRPQYLIDPSPDKLVELIKKGFFKEKTLLVKIQ